MCQNYYLYEKDGVVSVLPWDYNLSFGAFSQGGGAPGQGNTDNGNDVDKATQAVNFPIDTPVEGVEMEDRPLISVLLSFDEYKNLYHTYLKEVATYAEGDFISKLNKKKKDIYPYILKDATTPYTEDEFLTAFDTAVRFITLRSNSVIGQIDGTVPSTEDLQDKEKTKLVKADFSLSDMGSMGGGQGGPGGPGENSDKNGSDKTTSDKNNSDSGENIGEMNPPGNMSFNQDNNGQPPMPPGGMNQNTNQSDNQSNVLLLLITALVFMGAFAGVYLYKRKY
jgi:hypothetical protein